MISHSRLCTGVDLTMRFSRDVQWNWGNLGLTDGTRFKIVYVL